MSVELDQATWESGQAEWEPAERPVMPMDPLMVMPLPRWKRAFDILGAGLGLLAFSPLMLAAAVLIKLTSKGSVIFVQQRAGLGGRPFRFLKFRSMVADAEGQKAELVWFNEQTGPIFKMRKDPRMTMLGRLLRKMSIDELPQLWNVLQGDMSLVGPLPPTLDEVPFYSEWQRRRLEMTPGLTCFWQTSGRSHIGFNEWVRMDIRYSTECSFLTDLKILLMTVPAVLSCKGAH